MDKKDSRRKREITSSRYLAALGPLLLAFAMGCSSTQRAVPQTTKWKIFSNRAGWNINYPADWTVSSCHNCADPTDPDVFVSFIPPQGKDYDEGMVVVQHLADKPRSTSVDNWLASIKQTDNLNPIVSEEKFSLNNLHALKVRYGTFPAVEMQEIYVISGESTFSIGFNGNTPGVVAMEKFRNYPIYLQMVTTFRTKQRGTSSNSVSPNS